MTSISKLLTFPESNIHSKVGYNAFYSQLIRFYRLCNNVIDFIARVKMLYNKLERRGYSGKILLKYFLKFCTQYPAATKYSVTDGESLWLMVENYCTTKSCCVYDYDAIDDIVKPCTVVLTDMYFKEKAKQTPFLKPCTVHWKILNQKILIRLVLETSIRFYPRVLLIQKIIVISIVSFRFYIEV